MLIPGHDRKTYILEKTLTMHVVRDTIRAGEDDRLFSEGEKFCYGVSDIQKENICQQIRLHQNITLYERRAFAMHLELGELDYVTNLRHAGVYCMKYAGGIAKIFIQTLQSSR